MVLNAELDKLAGTEIGIDNLYPAVVECFSVILLGFIAGKAGVISQSETKGFNSFIGKFSLPSLIFLSLAQLDLKSVNWWFLLAILLAKTLVFFSVMLISSLVNRGTKLDKAGIFAIFCTQSNDFALGYPIIAALYGKTHPEYAGYLYLAAPVNLLLLNPIAFILMEVSKQKEVERLQIESDGAKGLQYERPKYQIVKRVILNLCCNPVIIMTALGILGNLIFKHCVPAILEGILKVLGSAFSACALFSLGLTMVGSAASLKGSGILVPGILISVKLLVLPVVTREMVSLLQPGMNANDTASLSNFGFLYGTFPSAPGVFVYANQYDVAVQMIASAMVACTFVSAPLMFVSAKMITLQKLNPRDYVHDLDTFLQNISVLAFLACTWVIVVFVLGKKWRKVPHCFTLFLVVSQAISCLGAILWSWLGVDGCTGWKLYLQFGVLQFGIFSSRIFTAILAASLVFLRCRSLCFVLRLRPYLIVMGCGIPSVLVTVLMLAVRRETLEEKQDPVFQYGVTQALVAVMLLMICFIVTIGCLIMQQRYERQYAQYNTLPTHLHESDEDVPPRRSLRRRNESVSSRNVRLGGGVIPTPKLRPRARSGSCSGCTKVDENAPGPSFSRPQITVTEIEDLKTSDHELEDDDAESLFSFNDDLCAPSKHPCDPIQRRHCTTLLERYRQTNYLTEPEEIGIVRDRDDEFQMLRHIILLLLLCSSMFVGMALCIWTLIMEDVTGIYVELVFLDAALNFGQGFFTFMLFGLNTRMIVMPLNKWWRRIIYGEGAIRLPAWEELSTETREICHQFLTYHYEKCMQDIVRDRRWRMEEYWQVFCGNELVDWLLMVGLARDRIEAIKYGKHLLNGRVIRHIKNLHPFHDQPFFYTFSPNADNQMEEQ
ncbi:integral membrane protein GPR155 isoform X2 [Folsomia candida]|nr:integral membrane protein GPR155 isoform X2 [Folsomia candida]XP_035705811.1 integral membrane protein GPR155 isoform X2 [Folsomia candida]XP_035705812.1 integral membrane protein GPR155 isoform X2 [Folsomia candida]